MTLRDLDIIEALKPIGGGWRYVQQRKDGGFERIPTTGSAPSGRDLVEQVRTFRVNEGVLVGDVERDVADYIRKVSPNNDRFRGKGGALNQPRPEPHVPLIQRIRKWLDETAPKKPRLLTRDEAASRAQTCIQCPQNIKWRTNCGDCNRAVGYLGTIIRGGDEFPLDEALLGCRLHGLHLPTAVFLDVDFLPLKTPSAPPECWLPTPQEK